MSESDENLWGELPTESKIETPSSILRIQATLLTRLTKGLLEGNVFTIKGGNGLAHELRIVVPTLDAYSVTILALRHGVTLYPVTVYSTVEEIPKVAAEDAAGLRKAIGNILQSKRVRDLIAALLAQAQDESPVVAARVAEE